MVTNRHRNHHGNIKVISRRKKQKMTFGFDGNDYRELHYSGMNPYERFAIDRNILMLR